MNEGGMKRTGGFCPKCGARIEAGDAFCVNCGAKLDGETVRPLTPTNKDATPPEKPKQGWKNLIWLLIVGVLAYGGGKLLGGQMAGGFKSKSGATTAPLVLNTPIAKPADAALPTAIPVGTPLPTHDLSSLIPAVTMPTLDEITAGKRETWDYHKSSDSEIREAMAMFWFGTDSRTGANCAFFSSASAERGGYYWWLNDGGRFQAVFDLGALVDHQKHSDVLVSASGETKLYIGLQEDGTLDFNFGDDECINGTMRLYPDSSRREEVLNRILSYKHTLENMS